MALRIKQNLVTKSGLGTISRTLSRLERRIHKITQDICAAQNLPDQAFVLRTNKMRNQVREINQALTGDTSFGSIIIRAHSAMTETQALLLRMKQLALEVSDDKEPEFGVCLKIQVDVDHLKSKVDSLVEGSDLDVKQKNLKIKKVFVTSILDPLKSSEKSEPSSLSENLQDEWITESSSIDKIELTELASDVLEIRLEDFNANTLDKAVALIDRAMNTLLLEKCKLEAIRSRFCEAASKLCLKI